MSGVSDFTTVSDSSSSEGITSRATARRSDSGAGTWMPLTFTAFRSGARPRTRTKRPSPWSRSMDTPGRRCKDSETLLSGNWPMASALTVVSMLSAARWLASALSMLAAWPITLTVSSLPSPACWAQAAWPAARPTRVASRVFLNMRFSPGARRPLPDCVAPGH